MPGQKHQKKWTISEDKFLSDNLNLMTISQIGAVLGRTKNSIAYRRKGLGLVRSPEVVEKFLRSGQFKNGHKSWNKGVRGQHLSRETEFKKGHRPANTKHDGCITERTNTHGVTYKYIRISNKKWQTYHRYVWEKHNGKIMQDHIIGFINGDTLDCRIENLYCLSKADNARRNHNYEKSSVSMKKIWASGRQFESDSYIAFTLFPKDKELRNESLKHQELIELKRVQLKFRRAINEAAATG